MKNFTLLYSTSDNSLPRAFTTVAKTKEDVAKVFRLNAGNLPTILTIVALPKKPSKLNAIKI